MTESHRIICERCGKDQELLTSVFDHDTNYRKPEEWREINADFAGRVSDLCGECFKDYMAIQEYFFEQKIENRLDLENESLQANIKESDENES